MSDAFDVIVVGFGYAGGIAAIAAHDAGARVLLIEKRSDPRGISVCSAGGVRFARDSIAALSYLEATNAGTTPAPVLRALAQGMTETPDLIRELAGVCDATVSVRTGAGNYPFAGHDSFGFVNVDDVPGFDAFREFPSARGSPAGARLFKVVLENVRRRRIETRFNCAARELLMQGRRVAGVRTDGADFHARGGVVLASGGFEGAPDIQRQFWPMQPVLSAAIRTNTGDGLRMAQMAGASLWHMWHYHGSYGFRHPDPAYPFGVRLKRLPDWTPNAASRDDVTMSWILVDRSGRRFMNEYEPYMQDTGHRPFEAIDFSTQHPAHCPAILIVDSAGRELYPLSAPTWHDDDVATRFNGATARAMDDAILFRFDSLEELARAFAIDLGTFSETVARWNGMTASGASDPLGRPAGSRAPIATPPYFAAQVWPIVSNTQGGPAHDERQRVLDAFDRPIPHLWEAGEIGSAFGHIYMSGGNLAECFVGGRIAGREAASSALALKGQAA